MAVYEMPVWERFSNLVAASDASSTSVELSPCFDLRMKNPEKVDFDWLRLRLKAVENADKGVPFNKEVSHMFHKLFDHPIQNILPQRAIAVLSNWFLAEGGIGRTSPRRSEAKRLWSALFRVVPQERLTYHETGKYETIIPARFEFWWDKQKEAQERRQV